MFIHLSPQIIPSQDPFLEQYRTNANICRQYIKLASERLYLQEATRISQANNLLEKLCLTEKERVKDLSQCDGFTTRDSFLPEDLSFSINLSNITERQGARVLTRRSNNPLTSRTSRDFQGNLSQALAEVEHNCTPRTTHALRKLLEDFRKLKTRSIQYQKKQKCVLFREKAGRHLQRLIEELQEKSIMLGQRLEEAQGEIQRLRSQGLHLREENKQLGEVLFQKMNEVNSERKLRLFEEIAVHRGAGGMTPGKGFQLLAEIISEKESMINKRLQEVQQIQARIQEGLFGEKNRDGAGRECCGRLRRLKGSILAYRESLQQEGRLFEGMFDTYKESLLQGMQQEE